MFELLVLLSCIVFEIIDNLVANKLSSQTKYMDQSLFIIVLEILQPTFSIWNLSYTLLNFKVQIIILSARTAKFMQKSLNYNLQI
jgi:hypothetical protein